MLTQAGFKTNRMVGDQMYPAFELRNILLFTSLRFGQQVCSQLCEEIGVGVAELQHMQFVHVWQVDYALEFLRNCGHDPAIGAQLGLSYRVASLDVLLPYLSECENLQKSLQFVVNHPQLVGSFTDSLVRQEGHFICVRWFNTGKIPRDKYVFQFEHSIASLLGLARELTGQTVIMDAIYLAEPERDSQYLADCTGAKIHFNADYYEWRIALSWLSLPITYQFEVHGNTSMEIPSMSFIDRVLSVIDECFPTILSLEAMALKMNMSDRSFRRKLAGMGSSYQKLIDQFRCQTAIELILAAKLPVEDITDLMGYKDVSHFRQSFKHWLGHPPGHFLRLNCSYPNSARVDQASDE